MGRPRKLSDTAINEAKNELANGATLKATAAKHGVSLLTAFSIKHRRGAYATPTTGNLIFDAHGEVVGVSDPTRPDAPA